MARDELRKGAGTQFDERVVARFLTWLEDCDRRGEAAEADHFATLIRGLSERKTV